MYCRHFKGGYSVLEEASTDEIFMPCRAERSCDSMRIFEFIVFWFFWVLSVFVLNFNGRQKSAFCLFYFQVCLTGLEGALTKDQVGIARGFSRR